jgi:hypothetical protein
VFLLGKILLILLEAAHTTKVSDDTTSAAKFNPRPDRNRMQPEDLTEREENLVPDELQVLARERADKVSFALERDPGKQFLAVTGIFHLGGVVFMLEERAVTVGIAAVTGLNGQHRHVRAQAHVHPKSMGAVQPVL